MSDTIRELYERKSVRRFEPRGITSEQRWAVIDAALQAPTSANQTLYTILEIEDAGVRKALAEACGGQPFIAKAPLVLVFLADCRRWLEMYRCAGVKARAPGVGDLMLAFSDALLAAQNSVTAAHALGLGSCFVEEILARREEVAALLQLEAGVMPAAMLVVGHPEASQQRRGKPNRFQRQYVVQKDTYRLPDEAQLREAMRLREGPGFQFNDWVSDLCARRYESDSMEELNRSVAEYLQGFAPSGGK